MKTYNLILQLIKRGIEDLIYLFFPKVCFSCEKLLLRDDKYLCFDCLNKFPTTNFHLIRNNPLERIFWGQVNIEEAFALYFYSQSSNLQKLIFELKYNGFKEIAEYFGVLYAKNLREKFENNKLDAIIPVPLHRKKLNKRGYNQAEYFAKGLSKGLDIPVYNNVISRIIDSESQTSKKGYEKWENVRNIFSVKNPDLIENKKILLVDDIITTGSTIISAAGKLANVQNVKLYIASIGFTYI